MTTFATIKPGGRRSKRPFKSRRISLKQLRALLRKGKDLPKDTLVKRGLWDIHENPFWRRDRNLDRSVLWALTRRPATPPELDQAVKQANCAPGRACGNWSCVLCRHRDWRRRRAWLNRVVEGLSPEDVSYLTVIAGVTDLGIDMAETLIGEFKQVFHDTLGRYLTLQWQGRFEVDYFSPGSAPTGTTKLRTLKELGYDEKGELGWLVPHLHAVLVHPGVNRLRLKYWLRTTLTAFHQVDVKPLRQHRTLDDNLDRVTRYPYKALPPKEVLPGRGSRSKKPRQPDQLRYFNRVMISLGDLGGLNFDSKDQGRQTPLYRLKSARRPPRSRISR